MGGIDLHVNPSTTSLKSFRVMFSASIAMGVTRRIQNALLNNSTTTYYLDQTADGFFHQICFLSCGCSSDSVFTGFSNAGGVGLSNLGVSSSLHAMQQFEKGNKLTCQLLFQTTVYHIKFQEVSSCGLTVEPDVVDPSAGKPLQNLVLTHLHKLEEDSGQPRPRSVGRSC